MTVRALVGGGGEATQELPGSEMITRVPHPRDQREVALTRWGSAHRLAPGDTGGPPLHGEPLTASPPPTLTTVWRGCRQWPMESACHPCSSAAWIRLSAYFLCFLSLFISGWGGELALCSKCLSLKPPGQSLCLLF